MNSQGDIHKQAARKQRFPSSPFIRFDRSNWCLHRHINQHAIVRPDINESGSHPAKQHLTRALLLHLFQDLMLPLILWASLIATTSSGLLIQHGQGRKQHFNEATTARNQYHPLELKSLIAKGHDSYRLRHNQKYDFWFFTNSQFFGPHTDSMFSPEGMMMQYETDFAAGRMQDALVRNNGSCTIVDVGSNFGYFSLLALRLGCRVYAFEPSKNNYDLSVLNFKINGFRDWIAVNHPVGPGKDLLFDGWSSMNLNSQNKSATKGIESVPLSYILQQQVKDPGAPNATVVVDWLKVDVEGYEQEVLKTIPSSMVVKSLSIEVTYYLVTDIDYTEAFRFMHSRFSNILDIDNGKQGNVEMYVLSVSLPPSYTLTLSHSLTHSHTHTLTHSHTRTLTPHSHPPRPHPTPPTSLHQ